ncbi:MAG TPA: hypothetical protein PKK82_05150 [Anaerolineaceae bacterium]|nr:hypothetical protein [Anaerolineaceae bacterium]
MTEIEKDPSNQKDNQQAPLIPQDNVVKTRHTLKLGEKTLDYTVTTGTLILKEEDEKLGEKPKASIFYVAYQLQTDTPKAERPVTFSFNGGPGSASVWMHLGMLGPKRVLMDEEGMPLPPPYRLVDNEYTLLEESDLVFIDPVSTGFSRAVPGEKADEFHGVKKDIESVGDFIYRWTTRNHRWSSPKYLIGESYGTTRASGLSLYLQQRHGMYLNGIMLISVVLNFITLCFDSGNDLPFPLILPSYTASAWYHKALAEDLQADLAGALREAEQFAAGEYTLALLKGSAIPKAEKDLVTRKLSRLTGLSQRYLEDHNLRVATHQFCKELRRKEGIVVGRLDSRYIGQEQDNASDEYQRDPCYSAILGPYAAALNGYVREELEFESDIPYEMIKGLEKWEADQSRYINVADDLRDAFFINPALRVFIANGFYDLATPYFATEYTISHLGLPANLAERIHMSYFESGHMMYLHLPSLARISGELKKFVTNAELS